MSTNPTILAPSPIGRRQWRVTGRVQGVGYRPFVYQVAKEMALTGWVRNDTEGVLIEAQGTDETLDRFSELLVHRTPRQAKVRHIASKVLPVKDNERGFQIISSGVGVASPRVEIPPDLAICPECQSELSDLSVARRHHYGLINCTQCGPRYSILRHVPYDRPNTTMADFALCPDCQAEYDDPGNRRFHAQPTACHVCGPAVSLRMNGSSPVVVTDDPVAAAAKQLIEGKILAIKGMGGYHLACRADKGCVVQRMRQIKNRPVKPFAVMARSMEVIEQQVHLSDEGRLALQSTVAPIVLANRKAGSEVDVHVAPDSHRLGMMLPYTPLHRLLFECAGSEINTLVMTSANDSDEPLVYRDEDVAVQLAGMCDGILMHQRPIARPVDDTVVLDMPSGAPIPLRRSRGHVPAPIWLPAGMSSSGICVGGEMKNTVAVVREGQVVCSQHLGDIANPRSYAHFKRTIDDMLELFAVRPQWVAHDQHPAYLTTSYAKAMSAQRDLPCIPVQHHHAHAAALMAERQMIAPALVLVCDGTGYGTDGGMWGGELLLADYRTFKRVARMRSIRLAGGEAAARQPWRCALGLLYNAYGNDFPHHRVVQHLCPDPVERSFISQMVLNNVACAISTSAGRCFDGIAALAGICMENRFDGRAPMAMEAAAELFSPAGDAGDDSPAAELLRQDPSLGFEERFEQGIWKIDSAQMVRALVNDGPELDAVAQSRWAAVFHEAFAQVWARVIERIAAPAGIRQIGLSGGVFCNSRLTLRLTHLLHNLGMTVHRHETVPPNDGGLSLGQAAIAAATWAESASA